MKYDDAGKSFIAHMKGRDEQGLCNYANLIYAGLAAVPGAACHHEALKLDLLPWVSRCALCNEPVGEPSDCQGCYDLFVNLRINTVAALIKHRHTTFYSVDDYFNVKKHGPRKGQATVDGEVIH